MEHIVTFLPGQFAKEDFFCVEMTGITYPDSRYRIERECSDIYCLEYVIAGEGQIETGGRLFRPSQGDVYLLPVGSAHCYRSDPSHPWEKIWMNVRGSLCDFLVRSYGWEAKPCFPPVRFCPYFRNSCGCVRTGKKTKRPCTGGRRCCSTKSCRTWPRTPRGRTAGFPSPPPGSAPYWTGIYTTASAFPIFPARQISRLPS